MIFENVKEIEISTVNGKVEIEGWNNDHVEVSYTIHGEAEVEVEQRGEKLIIREEPKKKLLNLLGKSGWAEITIKVPRKVTVRASSVNGETRAGNASFDKVSTVNGRIELEDCEAGKISTVNGSITVTLSDFCDARIKVGRVNGTVTFEGIDPENPIIGTGEFEVKVSTVNGNIVVRRV
ncbi:hypothetical protein E3E29_03085 [Thermococcus sp. Bubb.Bath]|nr:DUF4097 family beta strand repeat-containing protein [Thermococcus sp. Bubb.Bath]NJF24656.1 hypothetical protein [Thermococcus sp. Bubb.Bath]